MPDDAILIHAVCADRMCDDCGRDLDKLHAALRKAEAQREAAIEDRRQLEAEANKLALRITDACDQRDAERGRAEALEKHHDALAKAVLDLGIYRHATLGHNDYFHRACEEKLCAEHRDLLRVRALAGDPRQEPYCAACAALHKNHWAVAEPEREGANQ